MKTFRTVLGLILCVCLLPIASFSAMAADTNALLASLSVDEFVSIEFDPYEFEYEIAVPYRYEKNNFKNFFVPTVTAVAEDENATVDVTYVNDPSCGPTSILVKVTAANGVATQLYTISLTRVGQNLYADGGFEQFEQEDPNPTWGAYSHTTITPVSDDVYAGNKSMKVEHRDYSYYFEDTLPRLTEGKNYIASSVVKLASGTQAHNTYNLFYKLDGETAKATPKYWNADGTERSDSKVELTSEWQRTYATLDNAEAYKVVNFYNKWGKEDPILVDDYYIGETVVADVVVTDAEGEERKSFTAGTEASVQLSVEIQNQFGNIVGLANETEEWKLVGAPSGVSISENGLLTISAEATGGAFTVEAVVDPVCNDVQGEVKGEYKVFIADGTEALLSDINISAPAVIDFNGANEYTVDVPYRYDYEQKKMNVEMPVVTPVAIAGAKAKVTYPEAVTNGAQILVEAESADGKKFTTYKLNLNLVGGNMYEDGGFEQGKSKWEALGATITAVEDAYAGDYALQVSRTNNGLYWAKTQPILSAEKTYITSNVIKLHPDETGLKANGKQYDPRNWFEGTSGATTTYWNEDGTKKGGDNPSIMYPTHEWQRAFATIETTEENTIKNYYTIWAAEPTIYVDDYYIGEVVIADVAVTDSEGENEKTLLMTEGKNETISLTADILNQFGNTIGLKDKTSMQWKVAGNPSGVTVENGVVSVDAAAQAGEYTIVAEVTPTYEGAVQKKAVGLYELKVQKNQFTFAKGNQIITSIQNGDITCAMTYTNVTDAPVTGTFYVALYSVGNNEQLKLEKMLVPQSVMVEKGATGTPYGTITVPNDSRKYAIKCYFWTDGLSPIMVSGGIK